MRFARTLVLFGCALVCGAAVPASNPANDSTVVEKLSPMVGADSKTTQALGIETLGGTFTPLIEAGVKVPCSKTEIFSTATDNQDSIILGVYRGNSKMARDSHPLGRFRLTGIAPAKRGESQIAVTFHIDDHRTIVLSARDQGTGKIIAIIKADR